MTRTLKPWDQYVADAHREPVELPMPDGGPIIIRMPSGGQIRAFNRAQRAGDMNASVIALMGAEQAERLIGKPTGDGDEREGGLLEDAPGTVLINLVRDVMDRFGFGGIQGG